MNYASGVMVSILGLNVVECVIEALSGQTKYYEISICCFSAKHTALLRSKDWLAYDQDNVSDWRACLASELLFQ